MEYLDFELPIKELNEQYEKACAIGTESDVDVSNTCSQIKKKLDETKRKYLQKFNSLATRSVI